LSVKTGIVLLVSGTAIHAHSPFDSTAHITVTAQTLEATLVVGSGLAGQLLKDSEFQTGAPLPLTLAPRLFEIEAAATNVPATQLRVSTEGADSTFVVIYPRPATALFRLRATYSQHLPAAGFSALVVSDENDQMLGSLIVRPGNDTAVISLATPPAASGVTAAPASNSKPQPSFAEYFQMGVHHILTGPDHLLFLCGLLVVSRRLDGVLAIITCFTLAHSVTLGLAALNVVSLSGKIVEPIIAASIIFVGLENFRRGNSVKARCWLAFGFGLIHGFGLADALREAGLGATVPAITTGLFSFNLGVEAGQLGVAAIFLLLLWQVRKNTFVERYATQTISIIVILLGGWWLIERTLLA
jgi:hydrogenase/urease accessory protein HupE